MKRTYEQDLTELNITSEEFDNIISNIYGKTADEMVILAKRIRYGANVRPSVKRAFERVLDMRATERKEAYEFYYSNLNTMCLDCKRRGKDCSGTTCQVWTGCIYKEKDGDICLKSIPCCGCSAFETCTKKKVNI